MRGVTLGILLSELRAECGYSQNLAHGINNRESLVQTLKRTQRRLWSDWDWMHLRVSRDLLLVAGQRIYNCPVDLPYERIDSAAVKFGSRWIPLCFGIDERDYSIYDPALNQRTWPIRKWDITEDTADTGGTVDDRAMFEVWPMPAQNGDAADLEGAVRLTGIRALNPLNADNDRADLDNDLLVLFAAAELLGRDRKEDAQAKLQMANQLYARLRGNSEKHREFVLGGEDPSSECCEQPIIVAQPVPTPH